MFKFNAIMYAIFMAFAATSMVCLWVPACSCLIMICNFCAITPLFVAIVMTGIRRLNSNGTQCAESTAISDPTTGETFADNGTTMKALFIAQCVLQCPMACLIGFAIQTTAMGDAANASERSGAFYKMFN